MEIVSGDDNEGALFNSEINLCGYRIPVGLRVGPVQEFHALKVDFANLQDNRQKLIHAPVVRSYGAQGRTDKFIDPGTCVAKKLRMIGVGRDPTYTQKNQRLERADILVCFPEPAHVVVGKVCSLGETGFLLSDPGYLFKDICVVEVNVGQGAEQPVNKEAVRFLGDLFPVCGRSLGQADEGACQLVLKECGIGLFATDTGTGRTAGAPGCLFTLKAEHFAFHIVYSIDFT